MDTKEYDVYACPVGRTLELISGKWKPVILYLIQHGVNRFGLLSRKMPKISKKVLTEQLRELEQQQLIGREIRVSSYPQEVVYTLTEKGVSLRELIDRVFDWGIANMLDNAEQEYVRRLADS